LRLFLKFGFKPDFLTANPLPELGEKFPHLQKYALILGLFQVRKAHLVGTWERVATTYRGDKNIFTKSYPHPFYAEVDDIQGDFLVIPKLGITF
jgi:hypothetical protein